MRIKHFFGLAVLAAMTASCSSNNDLVNGGGNGSGENESGASYASITIDLLQQVVHVPQMTTLMKVQLLSML